MKSGPNNTKLLMAMIVFVVAMVGLSYASVPLYRIFCQATGIGGTTQRVVEAQVSTGKSKDRYITVTFDGNVDAALPWGFSPDVRSVRVKLGEVTNITYHATNRSDKAIVGTAAYNVQPDKVGEYFDKIQCFCFTQQVLNPGQTVALPVQFYVDEALANDPQNDDVQNITLSYTFFLSKDQAQAKSINSISASSSTNSIPNP